MMTGTDYKEMRGEIIMQEYYFPFVRVLAVREKNIPYGEEQICNPEKVVEIAEIIIGAADREYLLVISVDSKMFPVSIEIASIGTLNATISTPREVFKHAVLCGAYGILLVHNHPSGDVTPSSDDWKITKRMKKSGELLGIHLLDHVIMGDEGKYKSMAEMKKWEEL